MKSLIDTECRIYIYIKDLVIVIQIFCSFFHWIFLHWWVKSGKKESSSHYSWWWGKPNSAGNQAERNGGKQQHKNKPYTFLLFSPFKTLNWTVLLSLFLLPQRFSLLLSSQRTKLFFKKIITKFMGEKKKKKKKKKEKLVWNVERLKKGRDTARGHIFPSPT